MLKNMQNIGLDQASEPLEDLLEDENMKFSFLKVLTYVVLG